jgi:hypothetical protein
MWPLSLGSVTGARWAVLALAVCAILVGTGLILRQARRGRMAEGRLDRLWTLLPIALLAVLVSATAVAVG